LSLAAVQPSAMLVAVREVATTLVGAEGAWVSAHGAVDETSDARGERLAAASYASTSKVYAVPHVSPEIVAVVCTVVARAAPLT
jgi:hypothetical protein